jgi:regulator of protease activity HflC (stomatin/prohibitin superfamily)
MEAFIALGFFAFVMGLIFISTTFKVLAAWERAVILRLGQFNRLAGPGPTFLLPFGMDRAIRVDTRIITMDVPRQDMMTRDNVPVSVDAIVLFSVTDPRAAILNIENYILTTSLIAQTTLRSIIGQAELDELLSQRERLNQMLQVEIDQQTDPFGIKVNGVEIRDVSLPETMKRAMAAQAEAERDKRAKIINAEGEFQAAERLTQAAALMSTQPAAMQLRYLQSMREIATERNSMTILPLPIDMISPFVEMAKRANMNAQEEAEEKQARKAAATAAAQPAVVAPTAPAASLESNDSQMPALSEFETAPKAELPR